MKKLKENTVKLIDETTYTKKVIAIEDARKNISRETLKFDISQLWEKWAIGGLSRRVMNELGLTEISGDPRWDHMLDDSITAVYSDDAGRVWVAEDSNGKMNMKLSASDSVEFEKLVAEHYNMNRKAA
jgi:hypothetical protein